VGHVGSVRVTAAHLALDPEQAASLLWEARGASSMDVSAESVQVGKLRVTDASLRKRGDQLSAQAGDGVELTAHFHNTRGQGLANVLAALQAGVQSFESSFGELGGCPVPAGATGNIATEDLVSMLEGMGISTGIDLPALLACSQRVREILDRPLGSHTLLAGPIDWHDG